MLGILLFITVAAILIYQRASVLISAFSLLLCLSSLAYFCQTCSVILLIAIYLLWLIFFAISPIRKHFFTRFIMQAIGKHLPKISQTELAAIEAGSVSWEAELLSGAPDWQKLSALPIAKLSAEEQAFIDGPVEALCQELNDWQITHHDLQIPEPIWQKIKDQGFLGLIIPKEYGGKGFSAFAHAQILLKIYTRSVSVASTIAVPNSLGPAELLLHYGTDAQKQYYLPRLAQGLEIPCFALTNPLAGSDASSIPDYGVVCYGEYQNQQVLGIRLYWEKRYITLAPVATLLGLAFRLCDPDHLLGAEIEIGISCALIPATHPGVVMGRRHFPLNAMFQNGPTQGDGVFIPIDWVIGGQKMAGQGWRMLMDCLSAGRAVTLPSSAVASLKWSAHTAGGYARIRQQFNSSIAAFDGISEYLSQIAGFTYMVDAARCLNLALVDRGEKPAIVSAIMKYHATEYSRTALNYAMDIQAGKGICLGPKNMLGRLYQSIPIGITVEGANILVRSMLIFGQGLLRCHPYLLSLWQALQQIDPKQRLQQFDHLLVKNIAHTLSHVLHVMVYGLRLSFYWRKQRYADLNYIRVYASWMSAALALLTDVCLLLFGGKLKRKERISARAADILSYLFMLSAVCHRYEKLGQPSSETAVVEWCARYLLEQSKQRVLEILANIRSPRLAWILKRLIFPLGVPNSIVDDQLDRILAQTLSQNNVLRENLIAGVFQGTNKNTDPGFLITSLLQRVDEYESLQKIVKKALNQQPADIAHNWLLNITWAEQQGHLSSEQAIFMREYYQDYLLLIAVDDFATDELF